MNSKVINKDPATQRESLTELLKQLANNSAAVVHNEIELVTQGIREKGRAVRSGVSDSHGRCGHLFCRVPVSLRRIVHRTHFLYGPCHCGACHGSGACLNRCRHCLHRIQAIEEIDP